MDQDRRQGTARRPVRLIELCVDTPELLGQCEAGYSCAYMNSICWRTPTTPMPMEDRPRVVFENASLATARASDPAVRLPHQQDRSILTW
jgi:hypothetical protein